MAIKIKDTKHGMQLTCGTATSRRAAHFVVKHFAKRGFEFFHAPKHFSHTTCVTVGFEDKPPYTMAQVQLKEGPVVTAQLTDLEDQEV